jgi:CNP1-like family protein
MRGGLLAAATLALAGPVCAQVLAPQYPGGFRPEFEEDKPWEEQKWSLPPYPVRENLVKFDVGPTSSFEFFVDPASVSLGKDGVFRYALVARSASGATNVSYEGIRCESRERKLYAFGRADGTWAQARNADWARIPSSWTSTNNQHAALADEFFCPVSGGVRTADDAVAALKRRGHPGSYPR